RESSGSQPGTAPPPGHRPAGTTAPGCDGAGDENGSPIPAPRYAPPEGRAWRSCGERGQAVRAPAPSSGAGPPAHPGRRFRTPRRPKIPPPGEGPWRLPPGRARRRSPPRSRAPRAGQRSRWSSDSSGESGSSQSTARHHWKASKRFADAPQSMCSRVARQGTCDKCVLVQVSGERLNILFVSIYPASPPQYGGQRRLEGLMKELSRRHDVSAAALFNPDVDPAPSERAMREYCEEVTLVPARGEGLAKRLVQARSLFSRKSFEAGYFALPAFQRALDRVLSRRVFDVVIISAGLFLTRYRYRPVNGNDSLPRLVLDEHNIEFDLQRQMTRIGGPLRRIYNLVNWPKLRREEVDDWRRLDGVTFTSKGD